MLVHAIPAPQNLFQANLEHTGRPCLRKANKPSPAAPRRNTGPRDGLDAWDWEFRKDAKTHVAQSHSCGTIFRRYFVMFWDGLILGSQESFPCWAQPSVLDCRLWHSTLYMMLLKTSSIFFSPARTCHLNKDHFYKLGVKIRLAVKDWTNTITLPAQTRWPKLTYYQIKHTQLTSRSTLFLPKLEISLLLHSAWWLGLLVKPGNGLNKVSGVDFVQRLGAWRPPWRELLLQDLWLIRPESWPGFQYQAFLFLLNQS